MNVKRRLPQYVIGVLILALGAVFLKKAQLGMTPVTTIPAAVSAVTPLSLGTAVSLSHVLCLMAIIVIQRKINVKTVLILPLAVVFGWIVDLLMLLLNFGDMGFPVRIIVTLFGIAFTALGIVIIVGCDLMLPAPDALCRTISATFHLPLSRVKMISDAVWVIIAMVVDLIFSHKLFLSVGLGTVLGVLLAGRLVGVFGKYLPWLDMKQEG